MRGLPGPRAGLYVSTKQQNEIKQKLQLGQGRGGGGALFGLKHSTATSHSGFLILCRRGLFIHPTPPKKGLWSVTAASQIRESKQKFKLQGSTACLFTLIK